VATSAKDESKAASEVGADEVQAKFDEANAKGYFGDTPDEEPRENFTLKGVAGNKP
jgi:hypothetical protein